MSTMHPRQVRWKHTCLTVLLALIDSVLVLWYVGRINGIPIYGVKLKGKMRTPAQVSRQRQWSYDLRHKMHRYPPFHRSCNLRTTWWSTHDRSNPRKTNHFFSMLLTKVSIVDFNGGHRSSGWGWGALGEMVGIRKEREGQDSQYICGKKRRASRQVVWRAWGRVELDLSWG